MSSEYLYVIKTYYKVKGKILSHVYLYCDTYDKAKEEFEHLKDIYKGMSHVLFDECSDYTARVIIKNLYDSTQLFTIIKEKERVSW